jgi:hypothetical protein
LRLLAALTLVVSLSGMWFFIYRQLHAEAACCFVAAVVAAVVLGLESVQGGRPSP